MSQSAPKVWARRAHLGDANDALVYRQMLNSYALDSLGQGLALGDEHLLRVTRDLNAQPNARTYLAGMGPETCAFATCFLGYSTFRAQPLFNIHDIAVLPGFRGVGIGRALLRFIAKDARRLNCCKVTLEVREDNPVARHLYRSEGFGASNTMEGKQVQYLFLEKGL